MEKELFEKHVFDLLEKSEEAFLLSLEIINKPTISYRTEGFCFFICNAWELLLKAYIVHQSKDIQSIFYKDKQNRSLSFVDAIEKVFTSSNHLTKNSLFLIISIRNKSTHFVIKECDYQLAPLFQSVVSSYSDFFKKHFPQYDFNKSISPFISINRHKTPKANTLNLIGDGASFLEEMRKEVDSNGLGIEYRLYIVKKEAEADYKVSIDNGASDTIKLVNVPKDIPALYPYNHGKLTKKICDFLTNQLGADHGFTTNSLNKISKDYKAKTDRNYAYKLPYTENSIIHMYSEDYFNFIVASYVNDAEFRNKYCKKTKNN